VDAEHFGEELSVWRVEFRPGPGEHGRDLAATEPDSVGQFPDVQWSAWGALHESPHEVAVVEFVAGALLHSCPP
jgi:hypothetical protein